MEKLTNILPSEVRAQNIEAKGDFGAGHRGNHVTIPDVKALGG